MRRLTLFALVVITLTAGCKRRDRILVQATEEEGLSLASVVHVADPRVSAQLVRGFHDVEQNAWRWTMGKFAVTLRPPAGAAQKGAMLHVKFSLPEPVTKKVGAVTLRANVGGAPIEGETFVKPGEQVYLREVPAKVLAAEAVQVEFALDKFLPPGEADQRELGIIVTTIGFEPK